MSITTEEKEMLVSYLSSVVAEVDRVCEVVDTNDIIDIGISAAWCWAVEDLRESLSQLATYIATLQHEHIQTNV